MTKHLTIGIDVSRGNTTERTGVEEYVFQVLKWVSTHVGKYSDTQFILYTRETLLPELVGNLPENVEVKVLRWPPKRLWTQIRLSWEMLFHAPDILFIPGHVMPLIHPKKTVMTIHDIAATAFPKSYNWFERWYSTWSAKYAVKKLWKVIVPSEFTRIEVSKYANKQNIYVVPLAYDDTYRKISDAGTFETVLNKYHIQKPFLLSVGRLESKKNSVRMIHSFEILKKSQFGNLAKGKLVLVGGRGHGYEDVEKAIAESPYKKDIILPGYVTEEDLPYIMNAAEVFVFPSLYEGFGIPILEAFACGTPVVTSDATSCKEVAGGSAVLVDPLSVEDIARGIEAAMKREYVDAGVKRAHEFSWQKTVEQTFHVLLEE